MIDVDDPRLEAILGMRRVCFLVPHILIQSKSQDASSLTELFAR